MSTVWQDDRTATLFKIAVLTEELWSTTGNARADVRYELRAAIAYFRNYHLEPERAASEEAMNRRAA